MNTLTQGRLKELMHYDPDTGVLTWRVCAAQIVKVGDVAGTLKSNGYIDIQIFGRIYKAHRLAFLYMLSEFPPHEVDHKDGVRNNNSWRNLRAATKCGNHQNLKLSNRNKIGLPGVSFHKRDKKYFSQIRHGGRRHYLGYYDTAEQAHAAYCDARREMHKFQPSVREA